MDITLIVNGLDLSKRLSTYYVDHEVKCKRVVTTMDDTEYASYGKIRPIIVFSLKPGTEEEDTALYDALYLREFSVTYLDKGRELTKTFRLNSNITEKFLLKSIDGKRRFRGGDIQLRGK